MVAARLAAAQPRQPGYAGQVDPVGRHRRQPCRHTSPPKAVSQVRDYQHAALPAALDPVPRLAPRWPGTGRQHHPIPATPKTASGQFHEWGARSVARSRGWPPTMRALPARVAPAAPTVPQHPSRPPRKPHPRGTATPLPEMSSRPDLALSPARSLPQAPRAVPDLAAECHHLDTDHYATDGRSATRILPRQVPEGRPTTYPAAECTSSRCPAVTRGGIDRVIGARCGDDARPRNHPVQDRLGRVARPAPHSTACRS